MRVTQDILEAGISDNGAWNIKQLKALLPEWEFKRKHAWPAKGWRMRLLDLEVTKEQIDKFLALKNAHLQKTGSLF